MDDEATRKGVSQRVADTILGSKESWTRRMFELATQMRRDGGPVYDLSLGNPSLEPPAVWREAIRGLLADEPPGQHRYMTNAGFPQVRAFIADREGKRYGLEGLEAEDVTMTVGAAGGLNVLFRATLDPDDEVVVPAPFFSEYEHYCTNAGAQLRPVKTGANFALDLDAIASAIGPRTRILLLNSPNNPTGAIYEDAELEALADVLRKASAKHGRTIYVAEDSPYRDLVYDGSDVASMLRHYDDTVFITSHSKDLGLAGERIGYIVLSPRCASRPLLRRALGFCNRVLGFVNAPALMQRALPLVLGQPGGRVNVEEYASNCRTMAAGIRELGFEVPEPRAGFFLFPRLPEAMRGEDSDVKLTEQLREARTVVVPGTAFGVPEHLRLSMCVAPEVVQGALSAFRSVCG